MNIFYRVFGRVSWSPPPWLQGPRGSGGARLALVLLLTGAAALAVWAWLRSQPESSSVIADVEAPGPATIGGAKLQPQPLTLRFRYRAAAPGEGPDAPDRLSAARIDLIGGEVESGVRLRPALPGTWRWLDENTLSFLPAEDWPAGQRYAVTLAPELFAADVHLAARQVEFTTAPFVATIESGEFYFDPRQPQQRRIVATLRFSHAVDAASLERSLSLALREDGATVEEAAERLDLRLELDDFGLTAYAHSTPVALPERERIATLALAAGLAPQRGPARTAQRLRHEVVIPDVGSFFRVERVDSLITRNERDEPVQTVVFHLRDRVETEAFGDAVEAWLLPADRRDGGTRYRNYAWRSPREVTADVLSEAKPLALRPDATAQDAAAMQSLPLDVTPGRYVYLRLPAGLRSAGGFVLRDGYDTVVRAPAYPQEARIARDGAVLPLTGDHRLTFLARGVRTLRVEVGRLLDDQVTHLVTQSRGDISNPVFTGSRFGEDNITERTERFVELAAAHPREAVYASLDLSAFLPRSGLFFVTVQGWDRAAQRPLGREDRRFVLITDLGLLVKTSADGSHDVFVHSLAEGRPVSAARVELLGRNGIATITRNTDGRGRATFPDTTGLTREQTPALFLVRHGRDTAFIPFSRYERRLQYSRYDVGGYYEDGRGDRLRADLFTDRGLYRPGESVRLAAVVKRDDWQQVGPVPLQLQILDARGRAVLRERTRLTPHGLLEWSLETEEVSPTGTWHATLQLLDDEARPQTVLGTAAFRVQEFLPDRMRIRAEIVGAPEAGWVQPQDVRARVTLNNLYGTPARDRRVSASLQVTPATLRFGRHPGFVFDDPFRDPQQPPVGGSMELADAATGEDGTTTLALPLERFARGVYRLELTAQGFEAAGGRSVSARAGVMLSPLERMVGYRADGELAFVARDGERNVRFIAVDERGRSVAAPDLRIEVVERRYVSALVEKPDGTYAYQSVAREVPRSSGPFAIAAGGSDMRLPTERPGEYDLRVVDADGLALARVAFAVAGARNLAGNLEREAELALKLASDDVRAGEQIELQITAPYTGVGLITVERERVHAFKWFRADSNTTLERIRVPQDMEGNGYVNVAFIRDLDSPEVYVSPLSHAAAPFNIDRSARTLELALEVPARVRPGDELAVRYRTSQAASVIVFGVDEGILRAADYTAPDPLGVFLRKRALQVTTHQMVDLLLPSYEITRRAAAAGGGVSAVRRLGSNLNPFARRTQAPVAFWSGVLPASTAGAVYRYTVPDHFAGSLQVMAIAVNERAAGSAATAATVRGPFVISPAVLTHAAPGDEFEVGVGVANGVEGSGENAEVTVKVSVSEHLEVLGEDTSRLAIDEGSEGRARFRVRARGRTGAAELVFEVSHGSERTQRTTTLSVRPALPYRSTVSAGFGATDPLRLAPQRTLLDSLAERRVAASTSPLVLADGLLAYLEAFPHACVEQMVSRLFPKIGLLQGDLPAADAGALRAEFERMIFRLRSRQLPDGGFRFWPGSTEAAPLPSVYIMHFLTDAAELGLAVPADMRRSGLAFLRSVAAAPADTLAAARTRGYAIYVLTRNQTVTTSYLTALHEGLESAGDDGWRGDIVAVHMAASYRLLQHATLGGELIGAYRRGGSSATDSDLDTTLGRDALYLYLLARHFPERLDEVAGEDVRDLVEPVFRNRFNTLSSAYTILALGAYTRALQARGADAEVTVSGAADGSVLAQGVFARARLAPAVTALRVSGGEAAGGTFYTLAENGYDADVPDAPLRDGLEVYRDFLDASGDIVRDATVGDELTVRLRLRSLGGVRSNIAMIDLLPGGFEVARDSLDGLDDVLDYRDVREDRVVFFGSVDESLTEIRYRVRPVSAGAFVIPAVYAASMYDRGVRARSVTGAFEVRPPP